MTNFFTGSYFAPDYFGGMNGTDSDSTRDLVTMLTSSTAIQFAVDAGCDANWVVTIQEADPITGLQTTSQQFISGDTLTAQLWSGQNQPVLVTPTVQWIGSPASGTFSLSISAAQTVTLTPGKYRLRVVIHTTNDLTLPVLDAVISVAASPGTSTLPTSYNSYNDLLAYADWLDDLNNEDTDLSGFEVQRHKARAWLEGIILNRSLPCNTLGYPFGFVGMSWNGINYYIKDLLDQNRLVISEKVIEIVSRYAIFLICDSMISPTSDEKGSYRAMASEQYSRATNLLSGYIAEIDVAAAGIPPYLNVPVNVLSSRVPTPSCAISYRR